MCGIYGQFGFRIKNPIYEHFKETCALPKIHYGFGFRTTPESQTHLFYETFQLQPYRDYALQYYVRDRLEVVHLLVQIYANTIDLSLGDYMSKTRLDLACHFIQSIS